MHVHKSGGTTLCSVAGANGWRVKVATNCLQREGSSGGHQAGSNAGKPVAFWQWPTNQQRSWVLAQPVDLIANEGGAFDARTAPWPQGRPPLPPLLPQPVTVPLLQQPPAQGLVYVLTVRNPLDRILSHYRHEKASLKPHNPLAGTSFGTFVRLAGFVHWRSEFYVRLLGNCGWLPHCSSDEHLALALRALDFFSAVRLRCC